MEASPGICTDRCQACSLPFVWLGPLVVFSVVFCFDVYFSRLESYSFSYKVSKILSNMYGLDFLCLAIHSQMAWVEHVCYLSVWPGDIKLLALVFAVFYAEERVVDELHRRQFYIHPLH